MRFSDLLLNLYSWSRKRQFRNDYPILLRLLDPKKEDVILDVGAGTGVIANEIANISDDMFALEPNNSRVEYIKRKFPQVKAFNGVSESIPFPEAYFSKAYSTSAFHHFPDQEGALYELNRVIKSNGILVINDLLPGKVKLESRVAKVKFLSQKELGEKLEQSGFEVKETARGRKGYFILSTKS
ncbi:MAG: class I SAM-dependent methyltransferase [Thaumarchaeota archaeon]|nr:class I SAM-dependent methyltransferase [Nitrososphaerota archaeon]